MAEDKSNLPPPYFQHNDDDHVGVFSRPKTFSIYPGKSNIGMIHTTLKSNVNIEIFNYIMLISHLQQFTFIRW